MYLSLVVPCLLAVSVYAGQATSSTIPASSNSSLVPSQQCSDAVQYGIGSIINVKCTVCKLAINAVKQIIGSDTSVEKIKQALNSVCDKIPGGLSSKCKSFVESFGDTVIDLIVDKLSAKAICKKIKLCKSGIFGYSTRVGESNSAVSSGCALCKTVKLVVDEEKLKGKSEDDVSDAVERAYFGLPGETRQAYASIASIVLSSPSVDPCGAICYSPPQAPSTYASPTTCPAEESFAVTCDQCTPIVDNIKKSVQNLPPDEIVDNLDVFCFALPPPLIPVCLAYLGGFQPVLADQIVAGASTKATCQAISMC